MHRRHVSSSQSSASIPPRHRPSSSLQIPPPSNGSQRKESTSKEEKKEKKKGKKSKWFISGLLSRLARPVPDRPVQQPRLFTTMGRKGGGGGRNYSVSASDYKLLEEVGHGANATVYRAIYIPSNEIVAVKRLDLDRCNSNLDDMRREAQTMSLIDHPNVIRAYCSFVVERYLWVVMPFMAEGSCLHLMKIAYPDGFEESVIDSILKETLKALDYLHRHGHIHRDVKAGNILLDSNGVVKLGDFGVSACMFDKGDRQRSRNTFVGTPCWMAPEVLQPGSGYDFKADIWSFGITALELAHGHAPFSKYPPMKVLLMTIQNAPPGLDYDRDKRFSKSFKEMVAMCLVKDQTKRPTAEKLLKHSFFKNAKPPELSVKNVLADLPPLWDRVKALQLKDAAQLALKKMPSAEQEAISQSEYNRGVSAWNFNIEDLKARASLIQDDDDDLTGMKEDDENPRFLDKDQSILASKLETPLSANDTNWRGSNSNNEWSDVSCKNGKGGILESNLLHSTKQENFNRLEKDGSIIDPTCPTPEKDVGSNCYESQVTKSRQTRSGPLVPASMLNNSSSERQCNFERKDGSTQPGTENFRRDAQKSPCFSGPIVLSNRASSNSQSVPSRSSGGFRDSLEDKPRANTVQIKGRFSVTSKKVDIVKDIPLGPASRRFSQVSPLKKSASVGDWLVNSQQLPNSQFPKEGCNNTMPALVLMPHLQNLFMQTTLQQGLITTLLNSLQQTEAMDALQSGSAPLQARNSENHLIEAASSERERLLLTKIIELQARMINLTDELTAAKLKHLQLQQQLNAAYAPEEESSQRGKDS